MVKDWHKCWMLTIENRSAIFYSTGFDSKSWNFKKNKSLSERSIFKESRMNGCLCKKTVYTSLKDVNCTEKMYEHPSCNLHIWGLNDKVHGLSESCWKLRIHYEWWCELNEWVSRWKLMDSRKRNLHEPIITSTKRHLNLSIKSSLWLPVLNE